MQVRVTFQEGSGTLEERPRRTQVSFTAGHNLLEIAQAHGIPINAPCGGRASCGKCLVRVLSGSAPLTDGDMSLLSEGMRAEGLRLACQLRPKLPTTVEVQTRFDIHSAPIVQTAGDFHLARPLERPLLAVDLGSTSVQMRVFDPATQKAVGEVSLLNKQVRRGHDVMTRLTYALRGKEARSDLCEDARETLRTMWKAARSAFCVPSATPDRWVIAGNSVMTHLLWNESIDSLAEAPYRPAFTEARHQPASSLQLEGDAVMTFPLLGSFVGGDTAAGILALSLDRPGPPRMLIDIGTNTEVVLARNDSILLCSTPAGPAFEGGNISVGMRAEPGAIVRIEVKDGRIRPQTIGNVKAKGICGTGLIEVIVELVRAGLIKKDGAVASGEDRIALSRGVELLQTDIRELQLAKGALRTATRLILEQAGILDKDLSAVMLAGAFGGHLSPTMAMEAKMIPTVDPSAVQAVGNVSLEGACLMVTAPLLTLERLEKLQAKLSHLELALHPDFQHHFVASLNF